MTEMICVVPEWLTVTNVKDVVLTVAAFVASYVGLHGLNTWRRQLRGNMEYQLAKSVLRAVYGLRDALAHVRHPFMEYSQEPEMDEEKLKKMSSAEKHWYALAQAYQKRWAPVPKAKSALDVQLLETEVVWGRKIVDKAVPLYGLVSELFWAIDSHLEAQNPKSDYENPGREEIAKRRTAMYAIGDADKDQYQNRLNRVIGEIEDELRPHILQYHK